MKHTGEGSSSNHQPAEEGSPQQNSGDGEGNVRRGHGRGRSHPPSMQPRALPQMGRAGFSAFTPYRPLGPPPQENFPAASSGAAAGASRSGIIEVAQAVPVAVGGSSGSSPAAVGSQFGDSIARKRDIGHAEGGEFQFRCSVCSKSYRSSKALFGHLRLHPNRGWKGAFPPPSFRAEEDFSDVPILNQNVAAGGGQQIVEGVADDGGNAPASAQGGDGSAAVQYKVPDLNFSPLPDTDEE
ncbi:unnamed protein product [Fraxinus pennsylvanica]|uniref:C2H2-type domain-containing protein n=1 Tax=Fraxinus pennsylvanica TaxID=56036 RepID=A0AAD2A7G9_9LAMI|nr:unnamed protein product [Fraxinus pennsylvanica]